GDAHEGLDDARHRGRGDAEDFVPAPPRRAEETVLFEAAEVRGGRRRLDAGAEGELLGDEGAVLPVEEEAQHAEARRLADGLRQPRELRARCGHGTVPIKEFLHETAVKPPRACSLANRWLAN